MNVLDWTGPEFLALYLSLLAAIILVALGVRAWLRRPQVPDVLEENPALDPYEVAYLGGGPKLALNAALANLVHHRALIVTNDKKLSAVGTPPPDAHPLELEIHGRIQRNETATVSELHQSGKSIFDRIGHRLSDLGLVPSAGQGFMIRMVPGLMVLSLALLGVPKLFIGMERGKPVGFLIAALAATAVIAVIFMAKTAMRTSHGDAYLARLRQQLSALEATAKSNTEALAGQDLVVAMGLFGLGVLTLGSLHDLRQAIAPNATGTGCGAGCGSGCGGGGGGCGGGGCGGCGG